jgi:O-methyltransferase
MKKNLLKILKKMALKYGLLREFPVDFTNYEIDIIRAVRPYTLTSSERIYALIHSINYIIKNNIPGDIIECGVYKGGSAMVIAKVLLDLGIKDRNLYLFDTFKGMPEAGNKDISWSGAKAIDVFNEVRLDGFSLDYVKERVYSIGYDRNKIHFVEGMVEDTIPDQAPSVISLLRLDTDWYQSTLHELVHLFPRLSRRGVLIIDDYGYWQGAREAVDEYISKNNLSIFLNRIDFTGRLAIK